MNLNEKIGSLSIIMSINSLPSNQIYTFLLFFEQDVSDICIEVNMYCYFVRINSLFDDIRSCYTVALLKLKFFLFEKKLMMNVIY